VLDLWLAGSSEDESHNQPKRFKRKRKKKDVEVDEDIIDGFCIKSFKTYQHVLDAKHNTASSAEQIPKKKKEESTETSSANAHEESYVSLFTL